MFVPTTRVVLLGASNLTNAFPMVLESLQRGLVQPLEIYTAHGHGRSYGVWSRVLFRGLPPITGCELWKDLDQAAQPAGATLALITDVGNDLLYGSSPAKIAQWVDECLVRLAPQAARSVLTLLPLASIERLSALRYHATRMIFFPKLRTPFPEVLAGARELNERLAAIGRERGAEVVEQPLEWFGFDPIHIRLTRRPAAWQRIFSHWPHYASPRTARATLRGRWRSVTLRPAERKLLGRTQRKAQPALQLAQTTVRVY
jgi:hypothetical protein